MKVITWHTYPTLDVTNPKHRRLVDLVGSATYAWTFPSEPVLVKACELAREVGGGLTISLTINKRDRWWAKGDVPGNYELSEALNGLREHLRDVIYPTLARTGVDVTTFVVEAEWARSIEGRDDAIRDVHDAFDKFLRAVFPRADIMWLLNNGVQGEAYKIDQGDYAVGTLYYMGDLSDTDHELLTTRLWADRHGLKLAMWVAPNFNKGESNAGHVVHDPRRLRIVGNMCQEYGVNVVGLYAHAANWPPGYLDAVAAFLKGLGG